MKMLSGFIKIIASVSVLALLLLPQAQIFASYNDSRFDSYTNMRDVSEYTSKYVVPNLYRQDSVYSYCKTFPLVVSGGIEYVPVSVFSQFSYISVTYSKVSENFYLINDRNNHYISFDTSKDIAETHDGVLMKLCTKIFYQTRYLPAKEVAGILGLYCEVYDNPSYGVFALRVKDSAAQLSLDSLMDMYLVKKKEPTTPEDKTESEDNTPSTPQKPQTVPQTTPTQKYPSTAIPSSPPLQGTKPPIQSETPTQTPVIEDPIVKIAPRDVFMVFRAGETKYTDKLLRVLSNYRVRASFVLTFSDVVDDPSAVRKMIIAGHSLCVSSSEITSAETPSEYAAALISDMDKANNALKTVCKKTTRLCVLPDGLPEDVRASAEFLEAVNKAGYIVVSANLDADDYPSQNVKTYNVSDRVTNGIVNAYDKNVSGRVAVLMRVGSKTPSYTEEIVKFINKYSQFSASVADETFMS